MIESQDMGTNRLKLPKYDTEMQYGPISLLKHSQYGDEAQKVKCVVVFWPVMKEWDIKLYPFCTTDSMT